MLIEVRPNKIFARRFVTLTIILEVIIETSYSFKEFNARKFYLNNLT